MAIGRARTRSGLRVINFSRKSCMAHPDTVVNFVNMATEEPSENNTCCQVLVR